jgi:tetraacyldisaccharide-1-P 4'-kinase
LIIDNALLHAPSEILAQKSCAVAGIGDPGWFRRAVKHAGITPKAFGATTQTIF